jgi:hypothetical protein
LSSIIARRGFSLYVATVMSPCPDQFGAFFASLAG